MADDFGTAIYTNCAPGQGIEGVGGMQFQSHSPEVGRAALNIIRRHLIYEPPERLIRDRQPIEAFPPSFAHIYEDGIFATAAGVYIGREASGTRQGNHLTQAIVTSDPRAYRSLRPAQLFRASFWRTEPAPTMQSEPLSASSWEPGPLDAAEASRFVKAQPDGAALLAALLAALQAYLKHDGAAASRRILLISEHPESVLNWLTAATLLIPLPEALRIGFKVFSTDPARSAMPVVAVHPDWARSIATIEDDRGYAVFDLPRNRWTPPPEPAEAEHWAKLFCEAGPYDLNEMVELAAASGLSGAAARELAAAAVLGHTPSSANADELVDWLRTGPRALHEAYSGRVIGVLTRLQDRRLMRRIDDITRDQFPARNHETSLSLLRLELEHASRHEPSRPVPRSRSRASGYGKRAMPTAAGPEATKLVAHHLRHAQGTAFDAVLRVSAQFGVSVPLADAREATAAFVAYWVDNPAAGYDPLAWPPDPPVQDMLWDELSDRILRRPSSAAIIADKWWNQLPGWDPERADITSPLQRMLLSAVMMHSDLRTRLHIVEANLGHARGASAYYRELARVLWARTPPTTGELRALCRIVPAGTDLDPALFTDLINGATSQQPKLSELELCTDLANKHLLIPDAATIKVLERHHRLQSFESRLAAGYPPRDTDKILREIPSSLLISHGERLTRALLAIEDPVWLTYLLRHIPPEISGEYLRAWCQRSQSSSGPARIAVSFAFSRCLNWPAVGGRPELLFQLDVSIRDWCRRASPDDTKDVAARLMPLGDELVASWNTHVARNRPNRFRRLRHRWDGLRVFRRQPNV